MKRLLILMFLLTAVLASQNESETQNAATPRNTATPAQTVKVCDMLTVDEIKTAAGIDGAVGQSSTSGGADVCTWTGGGGKTLIVQLFPSASSYDQSRSAFEGLYKAAAEEVPGIGDKSFFIFGKTGPLQTGTMVAQKGSKPVSIQILGGTGDAATYKGEATAIAHVVLGKI